MSTTSEKTFSFKAETKKLLDIIINSLYQNKEVFLRELISNASDALNKIRIKQLTSEKILDPEAELKIELFPDKENNTLTIRDTGIGMTQAELKTNLGTIAQSGTQEFIESMENQDTDPLIGMFGVGFYSAFLVADQVKVVSRSFSPNSKAWEWSSEGVESFSIQEANQDTRGTDIILKLKEDQNEYLDDYKLKSLIKKYSNYVEFPIVLGEETLNDQTALWRVSPNEVSEEQYEDFYQYLGQFGKPLVKIHVSVDVPIEFHALLYMPATRGKQFTPDKEWGLKLYNRKILIDEKNKDLLPEYMRFMVGVVDAEDFDLNVSREVIQNTRIQRQIMKYLQKKVLDEIEKLAEDEDNEKYMELFREFGVFFKEGIAADDKNKNRLTDLLRFNSTRESGNDGSVSLANYVEEMKIDQEEIYYLTGLDYEMVKKSPHLEYYKKEGFEVLLLGEAIDSFLMMHLKDYNEKSFYLIDQDESEVEKEAKVKDGDDEEEEPVKKEKTGPFAPLLNKFLEVLGSKVDDVKESDRLVGSVARLVTPKGGISSDLQRAMKIMESQSGGPTLSMPMMGKILQINPEHDIIKKLNDKIQEDPSNDIIEPLIEQIHDNARLADGEVTDFTELISRTEKIMDMSL
ncbi:MAG: molecular chaperone HtpG [Candidatus Kariarchaeaceae archaeon]|jgi:molecular chaperone HtpG